MSTDHPAEELQANALLDGLNAVVDGQDMAIGLIASQPRAGGAQPARAGRLEVMDAPKH